MNILEDQKIRIHTILGIVKLILLPYYGIKTPIITELDKLIKENQDAATTR